MIVCRYCDVSVAIFVVEDKICGHLGRHLCGIRLLRQRLDFGRGLARSDFPILAAIIPDDAVDERDTQNNKNDGANDYTCNQRTVIAVITSVLRIVSILIRIRVVIRLILLS